VRSQLVRRRELEGWPCGPNRESRSELRVDSVSPLEVRAGSVSPVKARQEAVPVGGRWWPNDAAAPWSQDVSGHSQWAQWH
jgi:hypothetical protein